MGWAGLSQLMLMRCEVRLTGSFWGRNFLIIEREPGDVSLCWTWMRKHTVQAAPAGHLMAMRQDTLRTKGMQREAEKQPEP